MKAVGSNTRMSRIGSVRGNGSVSERRASRVNIVWSPRAIEHLAHLRSYIARDNPNAANRIASALLDAVERLTECRIFAVQVESPVRGNWSCRAHAT